MAETKSPKPTSATEQHARFIETARKLECDEDKDRFEAKLAKIAKAKPKREPAAKKPDE